MSEEQSRWDEIRQIQIESATAYRILGGLALVGIGIWIGGHLFAGDTGYGTNLYTEFISIAVTVFIIDILNRHRDERRREQDKKDSLLRDLLSPVKNTAVQAFHELHELGLISGENSILREANLVGIKPGKVDLPSTNLRGAYLIASDFRNAAFINSDLEGVCMRYANFSGANFANVNLKNADLEGANLENVDLFGADMSGANLPSSKAQKLVTRVQCSFLSCQKQIH